MNQAQALARLRKLLGPKLGYRINPKAPDADGRQLRRAALQAAAAERDLALAARTARREALLAGDADYQRLKAAHVAAQARVDKAPSPNAYRITVGRAGSIFFEVAAEGDNWQQVVDAVSAKA